MSDTPDAPIDVSAITADDIAPLKSVIVSAVGVAVGHGDTEADISRAKTIETAMSDAIAQAQAEGITDPEVIRERILAARDIAAR